MERRLIIIDSERNGNIEKYLRLIFFLFFGLLAFTSISYSSFYIVKSINLERQSKQSLRMREVEFFKDEFKTIDENIISKENSKIKKDKGVKDSIASKKIEDLQNNSFFRRFEDMILLYLGISMVLFIFLRKKGNIIEGDRNER